MTNNAIIVGASSGIGASLAVDLAAIGYSLGLVARRQELLDEIANSLPTATFTRVFDVTDVDDAMQRMSDLIDEMGGVNLFVISAGVGFENPNLDWGPEYKTIQTNVAGFAAMTNVAVRHLEWGWAVGPFHFCTSLRGGDFTPGGVRQMSLNISNLLSLSFTTLDRRIRPPKPNGPAIEM